MNICSLFWSIALVISNVRTTKEPRKGGPDTEKAAHTLAACSPVLPIYSLHQRTSLAVAVGTRLRLETSGLLPRGAWAGAAVASAGHHLARCLPQPLRRPTEGPRQFPA